MKSWLSGRNKGMQRVGASSRDLKVYADNILNNTVTDKVLTNNQHIIYYKLVTVDACILAPAM